MLATHEHPDGDALGSLIAMQGLLTALGKDSDDVHLVRTTCRCRASTARCRSSR